MDDIKLEEAEGIVVAKLFSGDYVIGEVEKPANGNNIIVQAFSIALKNPRIVALIPSMSGQISVAMKPICFPFTSSRLKDRLELPKAQVMFFLLDSLGEIEKEIINGYKADVSGITVASANDTASLASLA